MVPAEWVSMKSNKGNQFSKWVCVLALAIAGLLGSMSAAWASQSVTLGWDAISDPQIVGYRLHYGTSTGNYTQFFDVGASNTVTLTNLTAGTDYFFVVTCYNTVGAESLPSDEVSFSVAANVAPAVSLVSPGNTINGPATVTLSASASGTNASIVRVEFYAGSSKLGVATTAPYSIVWNNAQPGNYNLTAVAYDSNGSSSTSNAVPLNVVAFGATSLQRDQSGNYQLTVTGVVGSTCSVYVSEDLVNWRLLQTVANSGGTVTVSDSTANQVPRRFYKLASN